MIELWQQLTHSYNLIFSIPFGLLCLYWIISSLGLFDIDANVSTELEANPDADLSFLGGALRGFQNCLNASDVPTMLVLTFISGIGIIFNSALLSFFEPTHPALGAAFIVTSFLGAALVTRFLMIPLKPIFKIIHKDEENKTPIIGRIGIVKSGQIDQDFGQVEVQHEKNAPSLLNCILSKRETCLKKGEQVLIVAQDETTEKFIVCSLKAAQLSTPEKLLSSPDYDENTIQKNEKHTQ